MRYHYEKPEIYLSMYGKVYFCDHPVYHCCTLFQIGEKGLAVIQQRFDEKTKSTWWGEVDPWITDWLVLIQGPCAPKKQYAGDSYLCYKKKNE